MRAQTLAPAAGLRWLLGGFAIYRRNPVPLALLVLAYWFTVIFLNVLPVLGALAASLAIPGLSVGLMQAARNIERGVPVGLPTLFGSFRDNPRTLFALGALYLCCTLGVLGLSTLADGGDLLRYLLANSRAERAAVEDADFLLPGLIVAGLMLPVMMAWWFAPVLAAWHRLTLGRSLFFSFVACAMNWRPFLAYGLGLMLLSGVLPGLLLGVLLILFPATPDLAISILMAPILLIVAPVTFASFYAGYREIFGISEIV